MRVLTDHEVAAACGVARQTIQKYRSEHGIPTVAPKVKGRNLEGCQIGEWTVTGPVRRNQYRISSGKLITEYRWPCRCSCGTEADVAEVSLLRGHTRSCGCRGWKQDRPITIAIVGLLQGRRASMTVDQAENLARRIRAAIHKFRELSTGGLNRAHNRPSP